LPEIRIPVELQEPDEHLTHDAAADGPEPAASFAEDAGFPQDVEPPRRRVVEVEIVGA
jgi:hypothetical protein